MQHRILIEFLSRRRFWFTKDEIVQSEPFKYGFRFTNIGNNPTKKALVRNIKWGSAGGQDILAIVNQSYNLDTLNPGETKDIWVETTGTYSHGLQKINLHIKTDNEEDTIMTCQKDPFSKEISDCKINGWLNFFFIYSKTEYEQGVANKLMMLLAFLAAIMTATSFYYFMSYQIVPEIAKRKGVERSVAERCKADPNEVIPMMDGTYKKCLELLKQ